MHGLIGALFSALHGKVSHSEVLDEEGGGGRLTSPQVSPLVGGAFPSTHLITHGQPIIEKGRASTADTN